MNIEQKTKNILVRLTKLRQQAINRGGDPLPAELNEAKELLAQVEGLEGNVARQWAAGLPDAPAHNSDYRPIKPYLPSGPGQAQATPGGPVQDRTFRGMFPGVALDKGGFKSCGEFLEVINSQRFDPRLVKAATMIEGQPSLGGFSVPDEFSAKWLDAALPEEIIRPRCQVWPMSSATRKIPGWDDADQSAGAMFGGFAMEFLPEEGQGTYQSGKLRQIELHAKKGAIFAQVSNELIADGLGFEAQLETALVGSIRYGFDRYCLRGTGAGQPLGILNSSSLITVDKQPGQLADTIEYQNLCDMWARMYDPCRSRSVWIASSSVVPQLFTMGLTIGVGGAPVYQPAGGAAGAPNDTLFGRPLLFSPLCSALGDVGDIILVDLTQYAFGLRKEMSLDRSQHVGFQKDLDTWRVIVRFDGQAAWSSVVTPQFGATQSWAVVLEARA